MFCLNMIVKNESARIERALSSVAQWIERAVIVDTGSTDDTKDRIQAFFDLHNIPVHILDREFDDWSTSRNFALHAARMCSQEHDIPFIMLMDADMELVVTDAVTFMRDRSPGAYEVYQRAGACHYTNTRLVATGLTGIYRGVTHEYLDIPTAGKLDESVAYFVDHADGANRPEKYKRDIKLLKGGLKKEPNNVRYFFYLAQSYRDAGMPERAAIWYQRRIEAGGWDEEVWQAQVSLAHCYKAMKDEPKFISNLLAAYNRRPARAEPMYDLARYYRDKSMNAAALACAEAVEHLPLSRDSLFVNDFVYKAGIKEEIAINGFYVPGKESKGLLACDQLAMSQTEYWDPINSSRQNIFFYLKSLTDYCPSFKWRKINWEPPADWVAMNPSVCMYLNALHCNVRCVNYKIDDQGRYLIKATDGTANAENPINTKNFVLFLGGNPLSDETPWCFELEHDMPVEYPLVIGHEDIRLWENDRKLMCSATVRQLHADGNCEQVLTRLTSAGHWKLKHIDMQRMLRQPRETEKNWAPIIKPGEQHFMWRPGTIVNTRGELVSHSNPGVRVDNLSGSSQVVSWRGGYIALLHTAHHVPGSHLRHYYHRWVRYDSDLKVNVMSLPFYFNDKGIEFAAGLCVQPDTDELVISYGWKDCEARIATVAGSEVEDMLWATRRLHS